MSARFIERKDSLGRTCRKYYCSEQDCNRLSHSHGMCRPHWDRSRREFPGRIANFDGMRSADIPGWPGYRATDDGRIWTSKLGAGGGWRPLKPKVSSVGYLALTLSHENRQRDCNVHELVLSAFSGPKPEGKRVCRHLNGSPRDNRPENLAWGTYAENEDDKMRHGRRPIGELVFGAKLSAGQVSDLRRRSAAGETGAAMARELGLNKSTVCRAIKGCTWGAPDRKGEPKTVNGRRHVTWWPVSNS